jgi:hypothetical protein
MFAYPQESAAKVAIETVKKYLENNESNFDLILFDVWTEVDFKLYQQYLPLYFPKK